MESPGWLYCGGNARIFGNSEHENSEATGAVGKYGFVMDNLDEELIEVRGLLVWLRWEPEHLMFNLLIFSLILEN